jgi:hypothetical protein
MLFMSTFFFLRFLHDAYSMGYSTAGVNSLFEPHIPGSSFPDIPAQLGGALQNKNPYFFTL